MGIVNLLPNLSKVSQKIYLSDSHKLEISEPPYKRHKTNHYNGSKIRTAIDVSSWVASACHGNGAELLDERHLSNYGRAELLHEHQKSKRGNDNDVENSSESGNRSKQSCDSVQVEQIQSFISRAASSVLRKISSLQKCLSTEVLVVFDGSTPPCKATCCGQRKKTRDKAATNRDQVIGSPSNTTILHDDTETATIQTGLNKISAAKKAGAHTSETYNAVVNTLLTTFREKKIPFLVSPYEADGQLAYLSKNDMIDLIISEDSDFIGHGAKAVLYKYREIYVPPGHQHQDGSSSKASGVLIRRKDLDTKNEDFDLSGFNDVMLAILCVAAGCDYCNNLRGIGVKTARLSVKNAFEKGSKDAKLKLVFDFLFRHSYGRISPEAKSEYVNNFLSALVMFRHPIVFDPMNVELKISNYENPDRELMEYGPYAAIIQDKSKMEEIVGKFYCKEMAMHVVEGYVNPKTWSLFSSDAETPTSVCEALQKWNKETYELEREIANDENESKLSMIASQSSGTSSTTKHSSQTSNRSNISALSPNLV